ncbi:MAG: N-acetylglucosamine-6-phosphate deacetylase [Bacteroidales bacterium]|nr:N-acetylglucosamine-6-phosphate deacetylase [Bacteroidales bacterium]
MKESSSGRLIIEAVHYLTGSPVIITVEGERIASIKKTSGTVSSGLFVSPGLIDNQVNGYNGVDFSDESLDEESMMLAVEALWKEGVTSFLPTVITNSHKSLIRNFSNLKKALENDIIIKSIPGFHLEGPYISPLEGFYGCHPSQHVRKPSWDEFMEYQKTAGGNIMEVTLAPELDGTESFIRLCRKNGVIVAIGHTNASREQISAAVEWGARISTHLGNGCANLIDRHRNPFWPQLANDLLTISVIADGHHLLPEELKVFYKVKGPGNMILVSDVTYLTGMPPGKYVYLGSEVVYTDDGLVRNPALNCLAGASLPLRTGVENMMRFAGCNLGESLNLVTVNVARVLGLTDRGVLEPGKRADLILFELNDSKISVRQTILAGKQVFTSA